MATEKESFYLGDLGRNSQHEIRVMVLEPLMSNETRMAVVSIGYTGGNGVEFSVDAHELDQMVGFFAKVANRMRLMDEKRKAEEDAKKAKREREAAIDQKERSRRV